MSDPFKARLTKLSEAQLRLNLLPYPVGLTVEPPNYADIETAKRAVAEAGLDMPLVASVEVDRDWCLDEKLLNAKKPGARLYRSDTQSLYARSRVGFLVEAAQLMCSSAGADALDKAKKAVAEKIAVGGGAHLALGRLLKYYPKRGYKPSKPPTREEAQRAYTRSGLGPCTYVKPLELGDVRVNRKAENGFPIGGTGMTPRGLDLSSELARQIRALLESAPNMDAAWRQMEEARPSWTLCKGKAKYDVYSIGKVKTASLRFYNVIPRPMVLLMQQATQPFESMTGTLQHPLHGPVRTSQGQPLVRGGCEYIVAELERQLLDGNRGTAYIHHGDDSWVVLMMGDTVIMFALDCSSFDLTQHEKTTEAVHAQIYDNLASVDPVSAFVWHKFMRRRRVTISGTIVADMRHAGPSGMPLQSKVNDMLMEILLSRLDDRLHDYRLAQMDSLDFAFTTPAQHEAAIAALVDEEASGMGFVVRLEQFICREGVDVEWPVASVLKTDGFTYIGYTFYHDRGAMVEADFTRMITQLPYPNRSGYMPNKGMHMALAALKLAGVMLSGGIPTWDTEPVLAFARRCLAQYAQGITNEDADETLDSFALAGLMSALGPQTVESLCKHLTPGGLVKLWKHPTALQHDPHLTAFVADEPVVSWADEVEREGRMELPLLRQVARQRTEVRRPNLGKPRQLLTCSSVQVGRLPARPSVEASQRPAPGAGQSSNPRREGRAPYSRQQPEWVHTDESDWAADYDDDDSASFDEDWGYT